MSGRGIFLRDEKREKKEGFLSALQDEFSKTAEKVAQPLMAVRFSRTPLIQDGFERKNRTARSSCATKASFESTFSATYSARMVGLTAHFVLAIAFAVAGLLSAIPAYSQQTASAGPEAALSGVLSSACRQDSAAFANFLTADNATAYRSLAGPQRTALMKRFVLLEDPGRTLLSTGATGHPVIRCEAPGISTEMRFGEARVRENLAFIPMEIPLPGEPSRSITFGLVREGGNWKVLSVGLILLDIPSMAMQWEQADLEAREDNAIAALRTLATALETYRHAYGKLPDSLEPLGPAPKEGISPEAAGLVDADLAAGKKSGYEIRYRILPAEGNLPEDEANQAAKFELAATPIQYGDAGRKSFFLDSAGILRGADKKGAVATSEDPRIGSSQGLPSQR